MICPYCNIDIPIPDKQKNVSKTEGSYGVVCLNCTTLFGAKTNNHEIIRTTIMIEINNIEYWIILDHEKNTTTIRCPYFIDFERNHPDKNHTQVWHVFHIFPHIISITPANAIQKLKTILSFS